MLPITVQFIVAMLAYALNERMARKAECLREENRVLKEALLACRDGQDPLLSPTSSGDVWRARAFTPVEREECCQMVRPSTILTWIRQLVSHKVDSSRVRGLGRPRKANDIRTLVLRIALPARRCNINLELFSYVRCGNYLA